MTQHTTHHPLDHLVHTANAWLADVRAEFGTDDTDFAYRATRAWLHAVRDLLPVAESAHFAAQLPDILRGVYFDGWRPAEVPVRHQLEEWRGRAEAVDPVAADIECGGAVSLARDAIAEPAVACAAVEHVQRPPEPLRLGPQQVAQERVEAARAHRPLPGERAVCEVGQRKQVGAGMAAPFAGAVAGVGGGEPRERSLGHAAAPVRVK